MPKISLVIPVYGVEKYIDQLFESIRKQTLQDIEVIFVDDGSPDRCPELLDEFCSQDERYKVIHQKNGGVSVARNTGLDYATGEYVYVIDSDDWLADDSLTNLWAEAERSNSDLIYGDWVLEGASSSPIIALFENAFVTDDPQTINALQCAVFNNSRPTRVSRPEFSSILHFCGAPWSAMVKRSLIADNNLRFDPYVKGLGDDILFMLHLYEYAKKVSYIKAPIYHYRAVEVSYSHGYKANLLDVYKLIFEKMEQFLVENKKGKDTWKAYHFRVLVYHEQAMARYYGNTQNPKSESERFNEMKAVLNTEPYKQAAKNVSLAKIVGKRSMLKFAMLKFKMHKLYWKMFK